MSITDEEHGPWQYTEFGVLCSCGCAVDSDERCTRPRDLQGQQDVLTGALFEASDSLLTRADGGKAISGDDLADLRAARDALAEWGMANAEALAAPAVLETAALPATSALLAQLIAVVNRHQGRDAEQAMTEIEAVLMQSMDPPPTTNPEETR